MGILVAGIGAWLPARAPRGSRPRRAQRRRRRVERRRPQQLARRLLLLLAGGARLGAPGAGLPLFGYAAIALLLFGAVLLVPALTVRLLRLTPNSRRAILSTAVAQLKQNVGHSTLSLASIIVSFSLMVAMAIMVFSFRVSFEHWLGKFLPADLQMREPFDNDTAFWSPADQAKIAATPGVSRVRFQAGPASVAGSCPGTDHGDCARCRAGRYRRGIAADGQRAVKRQRAAGLDIRVASGFVWLPIGRDAHAAAERHAPYFVAGIWRDYARLSGSVVMSPSHLCGCHGGPQCQRGVAVGQGGPDLEKLAAPAQELPGAASAEIITSAALRERSLKIFDRAFIITYALEAIAVAIGLLASASRRVRPRWRDVRNSACCGISACCDVK